MTLVPFDDRDGQIWMNGALVPWRDATLHVLSHGLHYASGVFEGERAYGGADLRIAGAYGTTDPVGGSVRVQAAVFRGRDR